LIELANVNLVRRSAPQ